MVPLEKLSKGAIVRGLLVDAPATIVDAQWIGANVVEAFFKGPSGKVENRLLYREDENILELVETGSFWAFDSDGTLFRLASEAQRIQLAHLFDPVLAVHSSDVEPLPHQILAVYAEMLPRQPLRFLLADDPGAGKTIMAGLFIRELIIRDFPETRLTAGSCRWGHWSPKVFGWRSSSSTKDSEKVLWICSSRSYKDGKRFW